MPKRIESLYLHFPYCKHLCNYCDFFKRVPTNQEIDFNNYAHYLEQSFLKHQSLIEKHGYSWAPLKTLYIGGGTPSLWGEEGSHFFKKFLDSKKIGFDKNYEFTLEVNPGAWTEESLKSWRSLNGVNRFSLGIQTLNEEMIKYLDRVHSIKDVFDTLEYFKKNKLNFSVDFMLGLPFSNEGKRDIIAELEQVLSFNPSHFSVYILTVKDNYTFYKNLPSEELIEKEYLAVSNFLKQHGFLHYEVSNFSLLEKHSAHNMAYWKSSTVAALGPSATGFLNEEKIRYKWKTNSAEFEIENLTSDEFKLEKIYMNLRSFEGLELRDLTTNEDLIAKIIYKWRECGYLEKEVGSYVSLNSKGYLLLDSLINDLFSMKLL